MQRFSYINNVSDIEPYIKDCKEIEIKDKGDFLVASYNVNMIDTFLDPFEPNISDYQKQERMAKRECRGLVFDKQTKELLRRPFHKFKNIGESEETQFDNINWNEPHLIYTKLDGTMISTFILNDRIVYGTKNVDMGYHDLVIKYMSKEYLERIEYLVRLYHTDYTMIFEFMCPENRIVVDYGTRSPSLVLLACRNNYTGEYMQEWFLSDLANRADIIYVGGEKNLRNINPKDFDSYSENTIGEEGLVVAFENGERYKIKTEEYRRLHKLRENLELENNLVRVILNDELDDILPALTTDEITKVKEFQKDIHIAMDFIYIWHQQLFEKIIERGWDKKQYALSVHKENFKFTNSIIFKMFDGKFSKDDVVQILYRNSGKLKDWVDFKEDVRKRGFQIRKVV